jgi:hypothetical protein
MNMQDIPDNELDKLFKDSAKRYDINFEEDSWQLMEERLSISNKDKRFNRRLLGSFLLLGFLFSSMTGYYLYEDLNKKEENISDASYLKTKIKTGEVKNVNLNDKNTKGQKQIVKGNALIQNSAKVKKSHVLATTAGIASFSNNTVKRGQSRNDKENDEFENNRSDKEKYFVKSKNTLRTNSDTVQTPNESGNVSELENGKTNNSVFLSEAKKESMLENKGFATISNSSGNTFHGDSTIVNDNKNTPIVIGLDSSKENSSKNISPDIYLAKTTMDTIVSDTLAKTPPIIDTVSSSEKKENHFRFRRYSIGVLASPDFSSVRLPKLGSPGAGEGFFIEYHLTHRWTIYAGVIKTFKKYSSDFSGYKSTDGFWQNKSKTTRIDGSCNILDIPLNIKYYFLLRQKNLLFASLGMSSYLMLNEKYSFISTNNNTNTWDYSSRNNYYFSVVNFSLGYERLISKSFSVQAEPYIKMPLKYIGEGQIKLFTAGLFVSLKYNIR